MNVSTVQIILPWSCLWPWPKHLAFPLWKMEAVNFYTHFKLLSLVYKNVHDVTSYTPPSALCAPARETGSSSAMCSVTPLCLCSHDFLSLQCSLPVDCLEGTYSSFQAKHKYYVFYRHSSPTQTQWLSLVPLYGLCIHLSKQYSTSLHLIVCKSTFPPWDPVWKGQ